MAQFMMDVMVVMMPYMKSIAYAGIAVAVWGVVLSVSQIMTGAGGRLAKLAARVAIAVGLFFIACEIAGRHLGMEPTLLFSADPFHRSMFRNQWPFWSLGVALVLAGIALRKLGQWTSLTP